MPDLTQPWECVAELVGHSSWIYGVPVTPDGQMLASVSFDKILLWNLETHKIDTILEGHTDIILSLSLSPNGKILASGSTDKTVGLWDLETRGLICTLANRKDPIHSVTFSPDGKLLASGGESKYKTVEGKKTTIYLWNINSKELIHTFSGHDLRVNTLAFSPDGKTLASGSNDATVRLWDVGSGKQLQVLEGHSSNVGTVAFTPNGRNLISSGGGGIRVWDVKTGELQPTFFGESEYIKCLALNPTGQLIAFEVHDGIEIWNLTNSEKVQYLDFKWSTSIAFSPDGKLLASGDATAFTEDGGLVKVWRVPELEDNFDPQEIEDARKKITASITQRQGQAAFRQSLLNAYGGRCCITGCDVEQSLEAAHIVPYRGPETNLMKNGLLLRADIHILFDLYLMSINPETRKVELASQLANTHYGEFAGKPLRESRDDSSRPSVKGLKWHYGEFIRKQSAIPDSRPRCGTDPEIES